MTGRATTVRLLVGPKTPPDRIERHVQRLLEQIHTTRNITEVDVVVWDSQAPFSQYVNGTTRLYADTEVYAMLEAQRNQTALAEWGRTWKVVERGQKGRPPLYVWNGGKKGILTPEQSVTEAMRERTMTQIVDEGTLRPVNEKE
jgi:hypothetical protein